MPVLPSDLPMGEVAELQPDATAAQEAAYVAALVSRVEAIVAAAHT